LPCLVAGACVGVATPVVVGTSAAEGGEGGAGERVGVVVVELPQRRLFPGTLAPCGKDTVSFWVDCNVLISIYTI
jgi:hypothetical protein